ncbi:MAG: hypothetical protein QGH34_01925 [Candidatus Woesearchaeota archaeon]|nr:hypothetical protein [Candidatus Woesearchaeota archaeon]
MAGLRLTFSGSLNSAIIQCVDPDSGEVIDYKAVHSGIKGPDPENYSGGKTRIDAIVQNIEEDLWLLNFEFDSGRNMYVFRPEPESQPRSTASPYLAQRQ